MNHPIPNVLTIAGSDSGGGAGIQADLKTFSALGAYGASVITALTAQNTRGVTGVHAPEPAFVTAQLDAVFDDIRIDAVKIGMLANAAIVRAVAAALARYRPPCIVLDTVMISKSNHAFAHGRRGRRIARRTAAARRRGDAEPARGGRAAW